MNAAINVTSREKLKRPNFYQFSLLTALLLFIAVGVARSNISLSSGFITHDEGVYFLSALLSQEQGRFIATYGERQPFQFMLYVFCSIFGIRDVFSFMRYGEILPIISVCAAIYILSRILKRLDFGDRIIGLTLLSTPLLFVFPLTSAFILSESPALLFTLLGCCLLVEGQKRERKLFALFAFVSLAFASLLRETFLLYAALGFLILVFYIWRFNRALGISSGALSIVGFSIISVQKYLALTTSNPAELSFMLGQTMIHYSIGAQNGWTPIPTVWSYLGLLYLLYMSIRGREKRLYTTLLLFAAIAQLSVITEYFFTFYYDTNLYSALIRFSYSALPGIFISIPFGSKAIEEAFRSLRSQGVLPISERKLNAMRLEPKKMGVLCLLAVVVMAGLWDIWRAPLLLELSQTNLTDESLKTGAIQISGTYKGWNWTNPFLRFTRAYKSQPYLLYLYVKNLTTCNPTANILIVALPETRARVFLHEFKQISIIEPPENITTFYGALESKGYDLIFLYGEFYGRGFERMNKTIPYYYYVLKNETALRIKPVWLTPEGYLYIGQLTKSCTTCKTTQIAEQDNLLATETVYRGMPKPPPMPERNFEESQRRTFTIRVTI